VDVGLFAEALIYYECVAVNISTQPQLAEFLSWFLAQERFDDFLALVRDGIVKLYDYAFVTATVRHEDTYVIWNIQDTKQAEPDTFEQRFLYHREIQSLIPSSRKRQQLYRALRGNVIEVKASEFEKTIENARQDHQDPRRDALIVQAFVDELYRFRRLGHSPQVTASVVRSPDGAKNLITWSIDFNELARLAGPELGFHHGIPLTAGAISNRLLWSAAQMSCDLYLGDPMGVLVGDKLYESTERIAKAGGVIGELKARVEFPDVRGLVNDGQLDLAEVLRIRNKAGRFRAWLQQESERDRDAIIAYHNEIGRDLNVVSAAWKTLKLMGILAGGAIGSAVGTTVAGQAGPVVGGTVGAAAGGASTYLVDLVTKLHAEWKPIVFGDWMRDRIAHLVKEQAKGT
jgi:hypothetical protein